MCRYKDMDKKRMASLAVLIIGIVFVLYYILFIERIELDSDFTDTVIWAEAMLTGNGLFDTSMSYAYTLPFGGSLLMAPFVALFGVGYKAHACGFIVFLVIFVFSLYRLMRHMGFNVDASMTSTGLILFLSLPSKYTRMTMWGHVIHYSLGLLFVIIALDIYAHINVAVFPDVKYSLRQIVREKYFKWLVLLAIISALFCTNGLTIILFFAIPFFGAIILERFIDIKSDILCKENKAALIIAVLGGGAGIIGFIVSKLLQRNIITVYDGMFKEIIVWLDWVWDFEGRIRCFLALTCGEITGASMESTTGIRILFMAIVGFTILIIPFVALISYKKFTNKIMKLYFIAYYILFISTMFIFDFSIGRGSPHRIVGLYMSAVICSLAYGMWLWNNAELKRFGFVVITMFSLASFFCGYSVLSLRGGENRFDRLGQVLEENGLERGFAEYWSSHVTTILSENKVMIAPVTFSEDGTIIRRDYNVRNYEFDKTQETDRYFVFMSEWEYETTKPILKDKTLDVIQFDENGFIVIFEGGNYILED